MDEAKAISLCVQDRDPRGFEFLVEKYRKEAFFHAFSWLGNEADAADACQESFARAFVAIPKLSVLTAFYPWFYRILRNHCLNCLSRTKNVSSYAETSESESISPNLAPLSLLEKEEEQQFVWSVLQSLPPEFREILVLKYMDGRCYEDIASILSIPRGSVMSRLYYARKAFRDKYQRLTHTPPSPSEKEKLS